MSPLAPLAVLFCSAKMRDRDPEWRPRPSLTETAEGEIRAREAEAIAAEARLAHLLRDAIPNTSPDWGVNRLRKELSARGFVLERPTRDPGVMLVNPSTRERVRIMVRPETRFRKNPPQKFQNDYYYKYKSRNGQWGSHVTIPNKDAGK